MSKSLSRTKFKCINPLTLSILYIRHFKDKRTKEWENKEKGKGKQRENNKQKKKSWSVKALNLKVSRKYPLNEKRRKKTNQKKPHTKNTYIHEKKKKIKGKYWNKQEIFIAHKDKQ